MRAGPESVVRVEDGADAEAAEPREQSRGTSGDVSRVEPTIAELAELAALQQQLAARLGEAGQVDAEERDALERVARLLRHEIERRTTPPATTAHAHLEAAGAAVDVFVLEVPRSRHAFPAGALVTGFKRASLGALRPLHLELLRPQRAFNERLSGVLYEILCLEPTRNGAWREWAEARLAPHVDPAAWHVRSARAGVGRAIEAAKRTALDAVAPTLAPLIELQRQWNTSALHATLLAVGWDGRALDEAHAVLAALRASGRPTAARPAGGALRALRPLWVELFRRQERFNVEIERALGAFFGIPRAAEDGGVDAYALWLARHEPAWATESAARVKGLTRRPLFSIVVPTYETPSALLRAALDSVLAQTYDRWQLCIADDGSRSPEVRRLLADYARRDRRIKVRFLAANGGIASATNAALELAGGDFVGFLDHDDTLAPSALAEVAAHLERRPDTDILYSDEDRIDAQGRRVNPYFKPDWSPELLRSVNYVCHFLVVRRELLSAVGGIRTGFDGSQDYDLVLRLTERTQRVAHVPRLLYHWRAAPTSTAHNLANKPGASAAGVRALAEHLLRGGERGSVEDPQPTSYRVRLEVPAEHTISIIVPTRGDDGARMARLAAALLATARHPRWELAIVGGEPVVDRDARVRHIPWTRPFHTAAMRNAGARGTAGDLLLFLHDDVDPTEPGWLEELAALAGRPGVGAVGGKLLFPDGTLEHAGLAVGLEGTVGGVFRHMADASVWTSLGNPMWTRNCLAVSGACLMVSRERFEAAGGFDERLAAHSDVALCVRLAHDGLRNVYTPHAGLVHQTCRERPADGEPEALRGLLAPWLEHGDPFYNPNLSIRLGNGRLRGVD
jgi:GT2 family glycosyltransferase